MHAEAVKNKNKSLLNETCLNCFLMSSEYSEWINWSLSEEKFPMFHFVKKCGLKKNQRGRNNECLYVHVTRFSGTVYCLIIDNNLATKHPKKFLGVRCVQGRLNL